MSDQENQENIPPSLFSVDDPNGMFTIHEDERLGGSTAQNTERDNESDLGSNIPMPRYPMLGMDIPMSDYIQNLERIDTRETMHTIGASLEDMVKGALYYGHAFPLLATRQAFDARQCLENLRDSNVQIFRHGCAQNPEVNEMVRHLLFKLHFLNESVKIMAALYDRPDSDWQDAETLRLVLLYLHVMVPILTKTLDELSI